MKKYIPILAATAMPYWATAQNNIHPSQVKSELTEPLAILLVIIAFLLLAVIIVLARGIFIGSEVYKKNHSKSKALMLLALLSTPFALHAQDAEATTTQAVELIGGISKVSFYFMSGIILFELIIVMILLFVFYRLIEIKKKEKTASGKVKKIHWIERFNAAPSVKGITDEELSMGHNFDGIEELDNPSPPWWRWGFALSIVFAVVYLWIFEVTGTGLNQYEELAKHTAEAEEAVKQYLANSANNVDENTVTYLNDDANLAAGQAVFVQMCAACHAADGGGNEVGPNLTDDYWLHGGDIKDIFKTIKYGVVEKGMKSWKDDYSPRQIAQLASFVKSLKGTAPANPKAPQGELYEEKTIDEPSEMEQNIDSAEIVSAVLVE